MSWNWRNNISYNILNFKYKWSELSWLYIYLAGYSVSLSELRLISNDYYLLIKSKTTFKWYNDFVCRVNGNYIFLKGILLVVLFLYVLLSFSYYSWAFMVLLLRVCCSRSCHMKNETKRKSWMKWAWGMASYHTHTQTRLQTHTTRKNSSFLTLGKSEGKSKKNFAPAVTKVFLPPQDEACIYICVCACDVCKCVCVWFWLLLLRFYACAHIVNVLGHGSW